MTEFRSVPEEVARVLKELEATRASLQTIAKSLTSMEKHIRRAFDIPKPLRERKAQSSRLGERSQDRTALLARFDLLRKDFAGSDPTGVANAMREYTDVDLRALARELGLSGARKVSLTKVNEFIVQKLRESALLGGSAMLMGVEERSREAAPETTETTEQASIAAPAA